LQLDKPGPILHLGSNVGTLAQIAVAFEAPYFCSEPNQQMRIAAMRNFFAFAFDSITQWDRAFLEWHTGV
jgi:hypothetical protein